MMILKFHYYGESAKLFFRTTGVFYLLLFLLAMFQANGIAFFVTKLFTSKVFDILRVAFGFTPANTSQFSLLISFCFAVVYEFLVTVLSSNKRKAEAYIFTGLVIMLSYASYLELFKQATPFYVLGLNVMVLAPLMVASLPPIGSLILSEGLVNKSISFAELSKLLVALENGYAEATAEIKAARQRGRKLRDQAKPNNQFQMPSGLHVTKAS
jgi:hypothetical protein